MHLRLASCMGRVGGDPVLIQGTEQAFAAPKEGGVVVHRWGAHVLPTLRRVKPYRPQLVSLRVRSATTATVGLS